MKKKSASLIAALMLVVCLLSIPAQAAVPPTVEPCYENIHLFYANLDIDDNGLASATGYVNTATTTHTIYLTVFLQKLSNGSWTNISSGTSSGTGYTGKTVSYYVTSGYYYRTKAVATVYTASGSFVESATTYSGSKYY